MKYYLFLLFLLVFTGSCKENDEISLIDDKSNQVNMTTTNGIPTFNNLEEFFSSSIYLEQLPHDERVILEEQLGYLSMKTAYEKAWEEYDSLETEEEFLEWKTLNYDLWDFSDDDLLQLPINRNCDAFAINWTGEVIIADNLFNLKDLNDDFYGLVNKPSLKSSILNPTPKCSRNYDDRRVEVGVYNQGVSSVLSVIGYKKSLWKWRRYDTNHHFEILAGNIEGYMEKCITVERSRGPAYFKQSDIVNGRFHAEGEGLSYRFITPTPENQMPGMPGIIPFMEFKGWTRGVPEPLACTVNQLGNF